MSLHEQICVPSTWSAGVNRQLGFLDAKLSSSRTPRLHIISTETGHASSTGMKRFIRGTFHAMPQYLCTIYNHQRTASSTTTATTTMAA